MQLSPPLIADREQFEEIEAILRPVLSEAWERIGRRWMLTVEGLVAELGLKLVSGAGGGARRTCAGCTAPSCPTRPRGCAAASCC